MGRPLSARRRTTWGLATLPLLAGAAVVSPGPERAGPPPGHTGGFGEPTCVVCHTGDPVNAYGGSVSIEGLPDAYEPGKTYLLTVRLRMEETAAAGFEMAARFAGGPAVGRAAGDLQSLSDRTAVTLGEGGRPYVHHTAPGTTPGSPDGSTWVVAWVAPMGGGPVAFHVAANSANGDDSPLGDLIFTSADTVAAAG